MNFLRFSVIIFSLFFTVTSSISSATPSKKKMNCNEQLQSFYLAPNYSILKICIPQLLEAQNDTQNAPLFYTTVAFILSSHPDYIEKLNNDMPTFPYEIRYFYQSLLIESKPLFYKKIVKNLQQAPIKQPLDVDINWGAYFASGDKFYLEKILKLINQDNQILAMAFEIQNRKHLCLMLKKSKLPCGELDPDKYMKEIQKKYGAAKFARTVNVTLAIWSLESSAAQDPKLKKALLEEFSSKPELDYAAKIHALEGKVK